MSKLQHLPMRRLIVMLIMAVCVGALALSSGALIWYETQGAKKALGDELLSVATLVGNRSVAAIAFDDAKTAKENLAALHDIRHVVLACIYGPKGEVFASYARDPAMQCQAPPPPLSEPLRIDADSVQVRHVMLVDAQPVAVLVIESSLAAVNARLITQLELQAAAVGITALFALFVAMRIQRLISTPLEEVGAVASAIVRTHDYSMRVADVELLELAELGQAFNRLMSTIEQQNAELKLGRQQVLARLERARAHQAALSELARAPAASEGDVPGLAELICRRFAPLFEVARVSVWMPAEGATELTLVFVWDARQPEGKPLPCRPACAQIGALLAHDERYIEVASVGGDTRIPAAGSRAILADGIQAFLCAAISASPSGTAGLVCFEHDGGERAWSPDEVAIACELADLLALVEKDRMRRKAEQALRKSEAYNKLLFLESCLPQGLLNPRSMEFVECNRAALEAFGFQAAPGVLVLAPGRTLPELQADGTPSALVVSSKMPAVLQGEPSVFELQFMRANGVRWEAEVHLDRIEIGEQTLIQFSLMDISARVQAQRALEQLNTELELRVEQRTSALSEANRQLTDALATLRRAQDELVRHEKLASLGVLVAGVAHELNTPIGNSLVVATTLKEHGEALVDQVASGTIRRSAMQSYLEVTQSASALLIRNLERAAEQVSRFKQVAVDQTSGLRRKFDLRLTLQEIGAALSPQFRVTPHSLVVELPPAIEMDSWPGHLEQVLINLIMNTLLHAHRGSQPGTTTVSACLLDAVRVCITVADDGCGIPPRVLPRIFDPFFTTRMGTGGNGLGLHIVYSLVTQALGGHIDVSSTPGQGARFTVEIPRVAPVAKRAQEDGSL